MTVKLSELADDVMVAEEEGHVMTAKDMRDDMALGQAFSRDVFIAIPRIWSADAERMIERFIELDADEMYEDWENRTRDALMPTVPKLQELLDQALATRSDVTNYYGLGERVEIDVEAKAE